MSPVEAALCAMPGGVHATDIARAVGWQLEDVYAELVRLEAAGRAEITVSYLDKNSMPLREWRSKLVRLPMNHSPHDYRQVDDLSARVASLV